MSNASIIEQATHRPLNGAGRDVGAVQGRLTVPVRGGRPAAEWERVLGALADAKWVTGDIAYRSAALLAVGGFDGRFRRNYREDSDLALRVMECGYRLRSGTRRCMQTPVPQPWRWWILPSQAGNADDALMFRLHGLGWQERAEVPRGRRPRHVATTAVALAALAFALINRRAATVAAVVCAAATVKLTRWRIRRRDRSHQEIAVAVLSSPSMPFGGHLSLVCRPGRYRGVVPWRVPAPGL